MASTVSDFELYDKAVGKYLKDISPRDMVIVYAPTDRAYYTVIKKKEDLPDQIPYKFISFYRDPGIPIDWNRYSSQAISGDRIKVIQQSNTDKDYLMSTVGHSIPVTLTYQVDVWGTKETDILILSQNILVNLTMRRPVLEVPINPDGELGRFHILDVSAVNNSDIQSEESQGKVYRHTYTFTINAWIKYIEDVDNYRWQCPTIDVVETSSDLDK